MITVKNVKIVEHFVTLGNVINNNVTLADLYVGQYYENGKPLRCQFIRNMVGKDVPIIVGDICDVTFSDDLKDVSATIVKSHWVY